jgi:hypothetical protein
VTDPSMVGYLPIPQSIAHEGPTEAILRFSIGPTDPDNESESASQVFLHSMGATAAFGQSFTPSPDRDFTIGSELVDLVHLPNANGCDPFTIPYPPDGPFIILLNRGGCTFLQKLVHATRAGASGVIVAGLPPSSSNPNPDLEEEGLLRPSASGESAASLREVEESGMIYVDWRTGDVLRDVFGSLEEGMGVHVEILGMDGQVAYTQETNGAQMEGAGAGAGQATREGRVGIGEWAIWNLRIVDGT